MTPLLQNGIFNPAALLAQVYQVFGPSYPPGSTRAVELAAAEAMSWLVTQGLLVPYPGQPSPGFYVPTRRAQSLKGSGSNVRGGTAAQALNTISDASPTGKKVQQRESSPCSFRPKKRG